MKTLKFWEGEFGDEYAARNKIVPTHFQSRVGMWSDIFKSLTDVKTALEVGAGQGINLQAIKEVSDSKLFAVEPNEVARNSLISNKVIPALNLSKWHGEAIASSDKTFDFVFTSGVLIHIEPKRLRHVCAEIYRVSRKYIVCIEYFSDKNEEVPYRGHTGKLFKRDFGAFWMDNHKSLKLLDYGFVWKRVTGLDNLTYWVFTK